MKNKKIILIYGGAFNPPHLGHARTLEMALKNFSCSELWLMPSADRRDKVIPIKSTARLTMLKILINELKIPKNITIKISKLEINDQKLSSTFETNLKLKTLYPNFKFYFMIGSDIVQDIKKSWYRGFEVFNSVNFLIMRRFGYAIPKELPVNSIVINKEVGSRNISSTEVRQAIGSKESVVRLLTKKVNKFIFAKKLYL